MRLRLPSRRYYMLVASLPALPPRVDGRVPITPERLEMRLRMLHPDDAEEISRMYAVLGWSQQFDEADDAAVVHRYGELMQRIRNPLARELLEYVFDVRMIAVALRARRLGLGPPSAGVGRWFEHVRRNFKDPDFKLRVPFFSIPEVDRMLAEGDLLELYRRYVLGATWEYLRKRADDYYFSFEAVVIYVARWNRMRMWQQLDAERGRARFEGLVEEALGEYASIY
ncbi:MAG TPA: DUF2764 family protein [Gammaproteobacteria bacterium]|nr:DUF2764 family protein [Gammaproteobacteria bacterium]